MIYSHGRQILAERAANKADREFMRVTKVVMIGGLVLLVAGLGAVMAAGISLIG